MAKKKTFEEALVRLEEIVSAMENNEIGLEESVKLYKEGVELAVLCSSKLENVEQQVTLLQQSAAGIFTEKKFREAEE